MTDPLRTAEELADALMAKGARAVALVGSHATGTATSSSDLDLAVVGEGPNYRLEVHCGILVSLGWATPEEQRRRFQDPDVLATHVSGWRSAVLLRDPDDVASELQRLAHEWDWSRVATQCDEWAVSWIVGMAEEVLKLVSCATVGNELGAGVMRAYLAVRLPRVVAIRRRLLYPSDNALCELVAAEFGPAWRDAQESALGLGHESHDAAARSAVRLYELAAADASELFDDRQRAVVEHALAVAARL